MEYNRKTHKKYEIPAKIYHYLYNIRGINKIQNCASSALDILQIHSRASASLLRMFIIDQFSQLFQQV